MSKRLIPPVDLSGYYCKDSIAVKPKGDELRIEIGGDRCRTVLLDQKETLQFLLTIIKGGKSIWHDSFTNAVIKNAEKV